MENKKEEILPLVSQAQLPALQAFLDYYTKERICVCVTTKDYEVDEILEFYTDKEDDPTLSYSKLTIKIHFPSCEVDNFAGMKHTIYNVYSLIGIDKFGHVVSVKAGKSSYSLKEILGKYIHSHVLPIDDSVHFSTLCTGSGPFSESRAVVTIDNGYYEWFRFAYDLDRFFHVESRDGGPYIRITNLGKTKNLLYKNIKTIPFIKSQQALLDFDALIKEFINYFRINSNINITKENNLYVIGESIDSFIYKISNCYKDYLSSLEHRDGSEDTLSTKEYYFDLGRQLLVHVVKERNTYMIVEKELSLSEIENVKSDYLIGGKLLTFKNSDVITDFIEEEDKELPEGIYLLEYNTCLFLYNYIIYYLNLNN